MNKIIKLSTISMLLLLLLLSSVAAASASSKEIKISGEEYSLLKSSDNTKNVKVSDIIKSINYVDVIEKDGSYYVIPQGYGDILKNNNKNINLYFTFKPIKIDDKIKINNKKLVYSSGRNKDKSVEIPRPAFDSESLSSALNRYGNDNLKVIISPKGHIIKKTYETKKGKKHKKEIILERGQKISIESDAFDRDTKGELYVTQSWSKDEKDFGKFEGYTYSIINDDGKLEKVEGIKVNAWGGIEGDFGEALSKIKDENKKKIIESRIRRHATKVKFNKFVGGLQNAQSWSAISSLFGLELTEWKQTIDEIFHSMFLGSNYWSEAICYQTTDLPDLDESAIFSYDEDGNLMQTATIVATKQKINMPNGTKYLYKISYYIRNPENTRNTKNSLFNRGTKDSTSSGLVARSSFSKNEKLDRQEKEFWNIIKKGAREIKNTKSKTSVSGTDEDLEYNIQLTGDRTILLFEENEKVKPGDEVIYTKKDLISSYSVFNYDKACIIFDGEKPRNLFYEKIDDICTNIIDVSSESPTIIPEVSSESRNGRTTRGNEFSGISGNTGGFTR